MRTQKASRASRRIHVAAHERDALARVVIRSRFALPGVVLSPGPMPGRGCRGTLRLGTRTRAPGRHERRGRSMSVGTVRWPAGATSLHDRGARTAAHDANQRPMARPVSRVYARLCWPTRGATGRLDKELSSSEVWEVGPLDEFPIRECLPGLPGKQPNHGPGARGPSPDAKGESGRSASLARLFGRLRPFS